MDTEAQGRLLSGLRVLLIVIPRSAAHEAHFFAGTASCDGHSISVGDAERSRTPRIPAPEAALRGFSPALLRYIIVPEQLSGVAALAKDVEACVAVFSDYTPAGGLVLHDAFFALGEGASGQPLIFQGDPE